MFDKAKLEALRAKYDGRRKPRSRPRNFARRCRWSLAAPIAGRCPLPVSRPCSTSPIGRMRRTCADFAGLDVALVGVPMDLGVTNRPGARLGPRAVRDMSASDPTTTRSK